MNAAQRRQQRRQLTREWPVGTLVTRRGTGDRQYVISKAPAAHGHMRLNAGGVYVGAHINDVTRVQP